MAGRRRIIEVVDSYLTGAIGTSMGVFIMGEYFKNWNYKKHAKLCAAVYGALFLLDMTVGYVLAKKLLGSGDTTD